jgi:hypothetical protein
VLSTIVGVYGLGSRGFETSGGGSAATTTVTTRANEMKIRAAIAERERDEFTRPK